MEAKTAPWRLFARKPDVCVCVCSEHDGAHSEEYVQQCLLMLQSGVSAASALKHGVTYRQLNLHTMIQFLLFAKRRRL